MDMQAVIERAQERMAAEDVGGWLVYDYRGMNPIFAETVGAPDGLSHVTRPVWLWIPARGAARLLASFVDQSRFTHLGLDTQLFVNRADMLEKARRLIGGASRVAMEYAPRGELPRVSKVDGGTLETVRGFGAEVVSSADILQYATQRWDAENLASHKLAAEKLTLIVAQAFDYIGDNLSAGVTEYDAAEFIRNRFLQEGMIVTDGPAVAVNEHSSDPHFDPTPETSVRIKRGDWVLIDLWSRFPDDKAMFGDITWTAYVGDEVPAKHQEVFDAVVGARDAALAAMETAFAKGETQLGWEVDKVARDHIEAAGYGDYFNHRLGHSLGREVHSNAVNLDSWETFDTRELIPGVAVTIEPGIYIPEFGVRSEIDVYMSESGPVVTTPPQREAYKIAAR